MKKRNKGPPVKRDNDPYSPHGEHAAEYEKAEKAFIEMAAKMGYHYITIDVDAYMNYQVELQMRVEDIKSQMLRHIPGTPWEPLPPPRKPNPNKIYGKMGKRKKRNSSPKNG